MSNQGSQDKKIADAWSSIGTSDVPPPLPSAGDAPPPLRPTAAAPVAPAYQSNGSGHVSLAQCLQEKGYHPVMLFGTARSGKSYLLASLFHYLQKDPSSEAICIQGEWILPVNTDKGGEVAGLASQFFNNAVMGLNTGKPLESTHTEIPFFIPVILRPNNGKPDIKLAFMESRGEDYKVRPETVQYFPELKQDIVDVYRNYQFPISLLVIAPFTGRDAYAQDFVPEDTSDEWFATVDQSLYGALQAYQANRAGLDRDNYLFVLTKWDVYTGGISNPEFLNPPVGLVEKLISERYKLSWNFFRNMRKTGNSNSMQYSAGLISGDKIYDIPEAFKPLINQFPKMLWNWIYTNATGGQPLYGDSRPATQKGAMGFLRKLLS